MLSIYDLAELFPNCWLLEEPSGFHCGCSSASRTCQELPGPSQHLGCYVGAGVRGPPCGRWPRALVWTSSWSAPEEGGVGWGREDVTSGLWHFLKGEHCHDSHQPGLLSFLGARLGVPPRGGVFPYCLPLGRWLPFLWRHLLQCVA